VETFKLADLYYMELSIKTSSRMSCDRLGVDPATGSSLILLAEQGEPDEQGMYDHTECDDILAISSSRGVEWTGLELASAYDAKGLVDELRERADEIDMVMRDQADSSNSIASSQVTWTLEYNRMGNVVGGDSRHTSKTMCYGVANALMLPPELDAKSDAASLNLILLDGPDKIRLCLVISRGESDVNGKEGTDIVQRKWPGRPFQYSSAVNPKVAAIVVDILLGMYPKDKTNETPTLLDPTCGSGTFLAFALGKGANAIGWDIKESCCDGARENLDYVKTAFVTEGMELSPSQDLTYQIDNQDAALVSSDTLRGKDVDCAVTNLPWGLNTPTYYEENKNIMRALRGTLRSDVPVAIISRDSSMQKELERIGFRVVAMASIPQGNFRLPKTSKKKKNEMKKRKEMAEEDCDDDNDGPGRNQDRASMCTITIAVTN